jgi:hypothetical protein
MKLALGCLLAIVAMPALAAPIDIPVKVPPGATWLIESSIRTEKSSSTGDSVSNGRGVFRAELRDVGADRHLVITAQPAVVGLAPAPISFEYSTDATLTPRRVDNWDEIRRLNLEAAEKADFTPAMIEQAKAMYASITAEGAASILVPQLPMLALGQGTKLEIGVSSASKDGATAKGENAANAAGLFTLVSVFRVTGRAVVTWLRTVPPQPMSDAAKTQFRKMVESTNPKASTDLPTMTDEVKQSCRFQVDLTTGLAAQTHCDIVSWNVFVNGGGSGIEHQTAHWDITQTLQKRP